MRMQKAEQQAAFLQSQLETRQQMVEVLSQQLTKVDLKESIHFGMVAITLVFQFREQMRALGFAPVNECDDEQCSVKSVNSVNSVNSLHSKEGLTGSQHLMESTPNNAPPLKGSKNSTPLGSMTSLHSSN